MPKLTHHPVSVVSQCSLNAWLMAGQRRSAPTYGKQERIRDVFVTMHCTNGRVYFICFYFHHRTLRTLLLSIFGQRCDARHWRSADVRSDPAAGEGKAGQVQQMSGTRRVELAAKRHQNYGRHRWFVLCCFYIGRRRCIIVSLNIIITLQRRNVLRATVRGCLLNYLQFVNVWGVWGYSKTGLV